MFNPLAWGILTFNFWLTLQPLEKWDWPQKAIACFSLLLSIMLLLSIVIPPWNRLLDKPKVVRVIMPFLFTISILGYAISWLVKLPQLQGLAFNFTFWVGFLWFIAFAMVLIRNVNRVFGSVVSALLVIIGILYFTIGSNTIGGIFLVVFGILLLLLANRIINIWDRFQLH